MLRKGMENNLYRTYGKQKNDQELLCFYWNYKLRTGEQLLFKMRKNKQMCAKSNKSLGDHYF